MAERYASHHINDVVDGPGDGRPTALQIVKDNDLLDNLSGKVVLITGCSSGIGIETARALKSTGAKIFVTARDLNKGEKALADILKDERIELLELRLDSLASVRSFAKIFKSKASGLNVLINNAGIMAVPTHTLTEDGHESQFATNYLGHFLLFQLLKPLLITSSTPEFNSRVVNVSSSGHRVSSINFDDINMSKDGAYNPWVGYGQSKTAEILMANEIERRYSSMGVHGWSVMPGYISTGLQVHVAGAVQNMEPALAKITKSQEQGAATTVWAAIDKSLEGTGGKYLEDVQIASRFDNAWEYGPGYVDWVYDEGVAARLWELSNHLVGFEEI